ncbi:MAG: hypothetical protein OXH00_03025 [Candidatus Poribacteria bacterium]|nr:hypothetical protein [Candidatus Poribacteria bacterium]
MPAEKLDVPRLSGEALKFAQNIVAIRMPYRQAVQAFLDSFPEYLQTGIENGLNEKEVFACLVERFQRMIHSTQRVSYRKIKETQSTLKDLLDCIPIASPFTRLVELEKMRQDPDSINPNFLKVLGAAAREVEHLMPRERTSPFSGLPDLIPKQTSSETEKTSSETPKHDAFGGAMMNHANTGKETSENS